MRVGAQMPPSIGARFAPVRGQPRGLVGREARVVLHQPRSHGRCVGIRRKALRRFQLVEPLRQALDRLLRLRCRQAEALEVDQLAHACRPHTGIAHDDIAAHAVAEQVERRAGRQRIAERIEIAQVVGEPVAVGAGWHGAAAEATPVRRDDATRIAFERRQRIDDELERCADVHPAMRHQQRWTVRRRARQIAPDKAVVVECTHTNVP